ncbi:receptor-type tyrosine-protein phosphatase delta-like isoform X2 [Pocillopora verrucosa]|uniref:receptor-type tyrosine-protein phosphatase delta-like isoform X2 n=1 Tax=Pocillopora verrucosa TaxID=203993 RepID=UPI003341D3C6
MLKYLVFLKLVLVFVQHKLIFAIQPTTKNNHVLAGHVFQAFTATDWFNCLQTCHDDPRCFSYNYQRSAEANGLCELNDCGVEDFCDREGSLFHSPGFVFQQIRTSKTDECAASEKENICALNDSVPTIPPQNVKEVNKTITSLFITWDVVPTNQNLELIPEYKVIYSLKSGKKDIHGSEVTASTVYINLTGLKIHRKYNITVLAFNQCGDGPSSAMLSAKTDEDRPKAAPQNLSAERKNSTSILVSWDRVPNGKRDGTIISYRVNYTRSKEGAKRMSKEVDKAKRLLLLTNLEADSEYEITVSASTSKGYGPASEPVKFHGTDWFNCLQACHDEPSCVSYSYQRSENANGLCELNDCGFEDLCNRDKFLTYSKGFVFQQIKTIIKKVNGCLPSHGKNSCISDRSGPKVAPPNISAVRVNSSCVLVSWERIPDGKRRGLIQKYRVNITSKIPNETTSREVQAPTQYLEIVGINVDSKFTITVEAANSKGFGPVSEPVNITAVP